MRLLVLGATGLVGGAALKLALSNDAFSEVIAPTRAPLANAERLVNPVGPRLEDLLPTLMLDKLDAVICALGTTIAKAGSKEAFRYVDFELPVLFGKASRAAGARTYVLVTAMGADANSRIFYSRTKGEVEAAIQALDFPSLTICRPSLIGGERNEARAAEKAALTLASILSPVLPRKFRINPAERIAASLVNAAITARPGRHWIKSDSMT